MLTSGPPPGPVSRQLVRSVRPTASNALVPGITAGNSANSSSICGRSWHEHADFCLAIQDRFTRYFAGLIMKLSLHTLPQVPLEAETISPDLLLGKSASEVAA